MSFEISKPQNQSQNSTEIIWPVDIRHEINPSPASPPPTGRGIGHGIEGLFRNDRKDLSFQTRESFHGGPGSRGKGYRLALFSWMASLIDMLILFSLSCVFLLTFSLLVNDSLKDILHVFGGSFLSIFIVLWLCFSALYMVMLRSFLGHTVGEWACGLRLGSAKQRLDRNYIFKVILRMSIIFCSGVIVLPILSGLLGRDMAGKISGIPLIAIS